MMTLKSSFKIVKRLPAWLLGTFFVIALIGFTDAAYLTLGHYRGVVPPCTITQGCGAVTTSAYATIFSLPVALLGAIYYGVVLVLTLLHIERKQLGWIVLLRYLTPFGFAASLYFLYIQAAILHAFCQYCLLSLLTSTFLFALSLYMGVWSKKQSAI